MLHPALQTIRGSKRWLAGGTENAIASRVVVSAIPGQLRCYPTACATRRSRKSCTTTSATGRSSSDPERNAPGAGGRRTWDDSSTFEHPEGTDASPLTLGAQLQQCMARLKMMDQYRQLMEGPMDAPDVLLEGAILIARHRYPSLDPQQIYQQLDRLAARVEELLPTDARYPLRIVQVINQVLYQEWGLRGNEEDYYNADNSCINRVLERKVGIPITLSLVYLEVARRVGLPMAGVNLPLHFMLRPAVGELEVLVDAFRGGEVCYLDDAAERISGLMGSPVRIDPALVQDSKPLHPRKFLMRMLTNLRAIYLTTQQVDMALSVIQLMRLTASAGPSPAAVAAAFADGEPPAAAAGSLAGTVGGLMRDEGLCYFALRRYPEALDVLREYLASSPRVPDEERYMVGQVVEEAKRRMQGGGAAGGGAGSAGEGPGQGGGGQGGKGEGEGEM